MSRPEFLKGRVDFLTWGPRFDVSIPFILLHTVTSRNAESGGILSNETLSDAELIFNTPNSCDQYEVSATVMRETATKY